MNSKSVFVTGGTGYLGQKLIQELLTRGHRVRALASIAVQFLDAFNEAPEGTNTGLVVAEGRTVRGLLPVRRAESEVELGCRLATH